MKKYWQLILIALVIITTISAHYIQAAKASNELYNVTFDKISGDDKYIDSLTMEGYFETGYSYMQANITKDETTLLPNTFWRDTAYTHDKLVDQHKAFMRGKGSSAYNFYIDDTRLIYIDDPEEVWKLNEGDTYSYNINVLNKENDTSDSFSVSFELTKAVDWISINNTAVIDNELKFVTNQMKNNGAGEVHLIVIDLKKQLLVSDTILDTIESTEKSRSNIMIFNEYENFGYEKYVVYAINTYNPDAQDYKITSQQLKIFNIETNELTTLEIPENIKPEDFMGVFDKNSLIISNREGDELVLYQYNIGQKRWLDPVTVTFPVKVLNKDSYSMQATNGKIYLTHQVEQGQLLQILDIENYEPLYEGMLKTAGEQKAKLMIYRFHEGNE